MGISSAGGSNVGGGLQLDWVLYHEDAEYGRAIYCNATDYGPLWTIFSEAGSLSVSEVMGAVGT